MSGGDWFDNDRDCRKDLISGVESCDDICTPLLKTLDHNREAMAMFWALNTCGIVLGIAFELSLLMYTAVRSAVRVSWALDLRLTPLNQDRAFVANMLVRAAFELGDPDDETMGVEAKQAGAFGESLPSGEVDSLLQMPWTRIGYRGATCHLSYLQFGQGDFRSKRGSRVPVAAHGAAGNFPDQLYVALGEMKLRQL